jgi:predicted dehydrogenase
VSESIRVGVIGAGANTRKMHLPGLQAIPGVEIREVANRSVESGQKVADEFQIPTVRKHWRDVATSPDVDAVVIGTWPYLHAPATCLALEQGKHVLCEARMAMNADEARTMLDAARQHPECVAQLVPSPFTLRIDKTVTRLVSKNKLGTLRHFAFEFASPPSVKQGAALHWRRNRKYSGDNVMVLGIAYESLLRWFGPAEWVAAHAETVNHLARDTESGEEVEVEIPDYLSVQTKIQNGMTGSFLITETGVPARSPSLQIVGNQGALLYEYGLNGRLYFRDGSASEMQEVPIPENEKGGWRVEEEFINAIRGEEPVTYTTFQTGLQYMQFTSAVHQSFRNGGQRVAVPAD